MRPQRLSEAAQHRAWEIEVRYFESIRARLFRTPKYRGKFIAVRGRRIVGVGTDAFELHRQMSSEFPGEVILIEQAAKEIRKVDLPGFRILKRIKFGPSGGKVVEFLDPNDNPTYT
jgi:hypothetical protein